MSDARAKVELDRLYAELPTLPCQRKCHSSCGPIAMSRVEEDRIVKKAGRPAGYHPRTLTCTLLRNNLCSVYSVRPLICRLWGVAEGMECPWGCKPEPRYLTKLEAYDFYLRTLLISEPHAAEQIEGMRQHLRDNPLTVALAGELWLKPRIE